MGFIDDVSSALNRGMGAAERTDKTTRLKMQVNDLAKERHEYAAQLGESLYEVTKDDPRLRAGRENLFDAIANIDAHILEIQAQIYKIQAQAQAAREAAMAAQQSFTCPKCGAPLTASYAFCVGCGTPMEEIRASLGMVTTTGSTGPMGPVTVAETPAPAPSAPAPAQNRVCALCGAPLDADDVFCAACGAQVSS